MNKESSVTYSTDTNWMSTTKLKRYEVIVTFDLGSKTKSAFHKFH